MILELHFNFSSWPRPWLRDYETPSVRACEYMHVCVCHIYKLSFISHSVMNVYGFENMFVKNYGTYFKKQHSCHSRLLKNH